MFDDLSLIDDKDCSGNCDKCPSAVWNYEVNYWEEPMIIGCKLQD